jgi:hypothetical protein
MRKIVAGLSCDERSRCVSGAISGEPLIPLMMAGPSGSVPSSSLKNVPTFRAMPLVLAASAAAWLLVGSPKASGRAALSRTPLSRACASAASWPTG